MTFTNSLIIQIDDVVENSCLVPIPVLLTAPVSFIPVSFIKNSADITRPAATRETFAEDKLENEKSGKKYILTMKLTWTKRHTF
jgi:hypothetical protein